MKTNEAPEKIFVPRLEGNKTFVHEWSTTKFSKYYNREIAENAEYIRKDAFMKKALAYLNEKFYFNNLFYGIVSTDFHAMEEMYEDFRKYMKGE